jgi:glycosyltransferase involved in cell wall biosynthesis
VPLKIGIDLTGIWRPSTGIFVYAARLARELLCLDHENNYTLFFSHEIHPDFRNLSDKFRSVIIPFRGEVISKQIVLATVCNIHNLDIVHFPSFPPPVGCYRPFIWTIHDATPWLYPHTMDSKGRLYFRFTSACVARRCRAILTVSDNSKRDILAALRVSEHKVKVVYEGVDDAFRMIHDEKLTSSVRGQYGIRGRFILTVGTLEPRKNLPRLIRAYRRLRYANETNLALVIVGRTGWKVDRWDCEGLAEQIVFTGFVPQAHLVTLYNLAEMFILPSLYEGFGFPPLEAMACGCPVIVSDRGSLPEVVGGAALLIDPESEDSIVQAIRALEQDQMLRSNLAKRGLERVKEFSWKRAAHQTLEIYREAVSSCS